MWTFSWEILFPFHSPVTPYSPGSLTHNEESRDPLQDLVEAEAGPQAEVGPEVVEGAHEAEPVHGGHLHPDLVVESEAEDGVGIISHNPGSLFYTGLRYQTRWQTVWDQEAVEKSI